MADSATHPVAHRDGEAFERDPVRRLRHRFDGDVGSGDRVDRVGEAVPVRPGSVLPDLLRRIRVRIGPGSRCGWIASRLAKVVFPEEDGPEIKMTLTFPLF